MRPVNPRWRKRDIAPAIYGGTFVTAALALSGSGPLTIVGMITGPLLGVWLAARRTGQGVNLQEGADIGFHCVFFGLLAIGTIYDVIWHICGYRLWKIENFDRLFSWIAESVRNLTNPETWILITIQMVVIAICAGIFGVPAGVLGARLSRRRTSDTSVTSSGEFRPNQSTGVHRTRAPESFES